MRKVSRADENDKVSSRANDKDPVSPKPAAGPVGQAAEQARQNSWADNSALAFVVAGRVSGPSR